MYDADYMTRLERANREMVDTLLQSIPDTPEEGEEMHSLPQVLPNTHSSSMTEINGRPELKNLLDKNSLLVLQKRKLRSVSSENNIVIHFNSLRKKAALSMIEGASASDWTIIKNELCRTFSIVCNQIKSIVNALSDKNFIRNVGDKNSRFSEKKSCLLAPISENINPRSSSMAPNHKLGGRYKQDDATILFKRNILADSHKYLSKLDLKFLIDASHFANDSNSQFLPTVNQRNAREINLRLLNSSFVWRSAPYAERNIIIDIDLPSTEENYLITSVRNTDSIPRTNSRSFPSIDNIDNYMNTNNNTIINGRNNTLIRPLATLPSIATVPHTRRTGDDKNRTSNQISCSVQARLDRASHLQRAIELLLISLPASLQEMLDAAAQPTVEDFIFRPQGKNTITLVMFKIQIKYQYLRALILCSVNNIIFISYTTCVFKALRGHRFGYRLG